LGFIVGVFAVLYAAFGSRLLVAVYGKEFEPYRVLVPFVALQTFLFSIDLLPEIRLRLYRQPRRLFLARLATIPFGLMAVWVLPKVMGLSGLGLAGVVVAALLSGAAWIAYLAERRLIATRTGAPTTSPMLSDGGWP
jgi:O-antigen/teichoic acid export membrane protein